MHHWKAYSFDSAQPRAASCGSVLGLPLFNIRIRNRYEGVTKDKVSVQTGNRTRDLWSKDDPICYGFTLASLQELLFAVDFCIRTSEHTVVLHAKP